jgi:hypothetical protein
MMNRIEALKNEIMPIIATQDAEVRGRDVTTAAYRFCYSDERLVEAAKQEAAQGRVFVIGSA